MKIRNVELEKWKWYPKGSDPIVASAETPPGACSAGAPQLGKPELKMWFLKKA